MSAELVTTEAGWWIIDGGPGDYRLYEVRVIERGRHEKKHVLRRQVNTGQIARVGS